MFRWITKIAIRKGWKNLFGIDMDTSRLDRDGRLIDGIKEELEEEYGLIISKSWWDNFVDSINRLPRPIFTFWVFYLLILPLWDSEKFQDTMLSYAEIPSNIAQVMLVIIGFWFLSRGLEKVKTLVDVKKYKKQLEEVGKLRAELSIHRKFTDSLTDENKPLSESAIKKWNENSK